MAKFISTAELLRRKNNKNEDNTTDDNGFRSTAELVGINDDFRETVAKRKTQLSQSRRNTPEQNDSAQDNSWLGKVNRAVYNSLAKRYTDQTEAFQKLNLPDNPSYTQIKDTISSQEQQKSAAARRGKDTSAYDKAIEMLRGYADKNYGFDTNTSASDREALYADKKRELKQLQNEEKVTDKTRPVDYYSKDDIVSILKSRGASYDHTAEENADFFIKYRQHIIPHGNDDKDENARRYQGLLAVIEQSNKELPNEKIAELQSKQSAIQDELRYYEKNKQSLENLGKTPEELVKDIGSEPFDYTNVEDVKGALGVGSDADAEFFVKYRQHIIPHGNDDNDENARKYQRLLEAVNLTAKSQGARKMYSQGEEVAAVSKSGQTMNYRDLLTHKVARNREADLTVSQEEAGNILKSLGTGSRDLTKLPTLTDKEQKAAGWYSNFKNGYHSYTYKGDVENGEVEDKSAVFSAIVTDSKGNVVRVLSPSEMEEYAQKALSTGDDPLKLQATETYAGFMGTSLAVENAKRINRLSERYFNNTDLESVVDAAISGDKSAQSNAEQYGLDVDEIRHYRYITDTQKQKQQASRDYAEWSAENVGTGALATGANILASPLKAAEFVINLGESWDNNIKANRSGGISSYRLPANYDDFVTSMTNESTEQITEGIRNSIKGNGDSAVLNWLGDVTANTYGGFASSAQSALTGLTARAIFGPGAGEVVALTVMSGEAANDAFNEVIDNGGTTSQAIMYGIASGTNEALFEKVSLDHLINVKDVIGKEGIKDIFLSALKQGGIEASEEAFTELANRFADDVINTDKSEYNRNVQKYIDEGYSDEEAKSKANLDFAGQVMASAWGGFVGGGFSTGIKVVSNTVANAVQQKAETRQAGAAIADAKHISALIEQANAVEGSEKITTQAAKVKALYDKNGGEKITGSLKKEAGTLYTMLQDHNVDNARSASENTVREAIRERVIAETGSDDSVAVEAVYKSEISGEKLSTMEQNALKEKSVQKVVNYVQENAEQIRNDARVSTENAFANIAETAALTRTENDIFTASDDGKTYIKGQNTPVTMQKVRSVSENDMDIELTDGTVVKASNIDFGDPGVKTILSNMIDIQNDQSRSAKMSAEYVNTALQAWQQGNYSESNLRAFTHDAREIYYAANTNDKYSPKLVSQGVADMLYTAATNSKKANIATRSAKIQQKKTGTRREGTVVFDDAINESSLNPLQKVGVDTVRQLAKSTGITFHFFQSKKNAAGKYVHEKHSARDKNGNLIASPNGFYSNGEIWVDINAGNNGEGLILFTVSHELVHFMSDFAPEQFDTFAKFLFDNYANDNLTIKQAVYREMTHNTNLKYDEAYEEVVARLSEAFLRDAHLTDKSRELYNTDKSVWEKVRDGLKDIVDRIKKYFAKLSPESNLGKIGAKMVKENQAILDRFVAGVKAASENAAYTEKTTGEGGARMMARGSAYNYDFTKSFSEQIKDWKNGNFNYNDSLLIGKTPDVFLKIGLNALPVTINQEHIDYAVYGIKDQNHYFDESMLEQLPEAIKKPIAIFASQSNTKRNRLVALLSFTYKGNSVIAPIEIDGYGLSNGISIDSNAITSIYAKNSSILQLKRAFEAENKGKVSIYYYNKKETIGLFKSARVTMPKTPQTKDGFIHSIRENNSPVKPKYQSVTESQQFKRWFGDWKNHPKSASKVVNADGTPKVVYHGTGHVFTVFENEKIGANHDGWGEYGRGFYATENRDSAEKYSRSSKGDQSIVMEGYIDVKKPLYINKALPKDIDVSEVVQKYNIPHWTVDGIKRDAGRMVDVLLENGEDVQDFLKSFGYDGIIDVNSKGEMSQIVFYDSVQFKSATDNIGTYSRKNPDIRYQSRDSDLFSDDDDLSFGEYDDISDVIKRQYTTHSEAIGEVLKNTADIDIAPGKVYNIVARTLDGYNIDTDTKKRLATQLHFELENAKNGDPEEIVNRMIDTVRGVLDDAKEVNQRAVDQYNDLRAAYSGKYYLTDEQIMDLSENGYSLNDFKKAMTGKMTIVKKENAARSINGGFKDASQLSLEGIHDEIDAEEILGINRDQWDEYGYHAPVMLMDAFEKLKANQLVPLTETSSAEDRDYIAVDLAAQFTGAVVQEKYNSRKNPYVRDLVNKFEARKKEAVKKRNAYFAEKKREMQEKYEKLVAEQLRRAKEQRDKEHNRRKQTEFRHRVVNMINDFNKLLNHPVEGRYVPRQFISQTIDFLKMINLDSGRSVNISDKLSKLADKYDKLKEDNDNFASYDVAVEKRMKTLSEWIEEEAKAWVPKRNKAIQYENKRRLREGKSPLKTVTEDNFSIQNMSLDLLQYTHDTLNSIQHIIRDSIKMTGEETRKTRIEIHKALVKETQEVRKPHHSLARFYKDQAKSGYLMFKSFADYKKNSEWENRQNELNIGCINRAAFGQKFSAPFDKLTKTHKDKINLDKMIKTTVDIGLKDHAGNPVLITHDMLVCVYLDLQNAHNIDHVVGGGYHVPELEMYRKGKIKQAYQGESKIANGVGIYAIDIAQRKQEAERRLNEAAEKGEDTATYTKQIEALDKEAEEIKRKSEEYYTTIRDNVIKNMTPYDYAWADAWVEFNKMASEAINDTTMQLYGFKKAVVDNYFPIAVDSTFRTATFDNIVSDLSLENWGALKERVKGARGTILLQGITNVVADRIDKTSIFCGMAVPMRNFQKVYGIVSYNFESDEKGNNKTEIQTALQRELDIKFGDSVLGGSANSYIKDLLKDLTVPDNESTATDKILSFVRTGIALKTLTLNPRVWFTQSASLVTALPEVDMISMIKGISTVFYRFNPHWSSKIRSRISEVTPLYDLRRSGMFNTEMGDIAKDRSTGYKKLRKTTQKVFNLTQFVDSLTTGRLWYVAEAYVERHTEYQKGTKEFDLAVAKKYNNILQRTQPNYTPMERARILRSKNAVTKLFTMWKTQRLQNVNILMDAYGSFDKALRDHNRKMNGVTGWEVAKAFNTVLKSTFAVLASQFMIEAIAALATIFLYHNFKPYSDDDDEMTVDSIVAGMWQNYLSSLAGNFIGGGELEGILESVLTGKRYSPIEPGVLETVLDLVNDSVDTVNILKENGALSPKFLSSMHDRVVDVAGVFGIALKNAEKIYNGLSLWVEDGADLDIFQFTEIGDVANKALMEKTLNNLRSGNYHDMDKFAQDKYKDAYAKAYKKGKSEEDCVSAGDSAAKSFITSTLKNEYVKAYKNNDTATTKAIRKYMYQSGYYKVASGKKKGTVSESVVDKRLDAWIVEDKKKQEEAETAKERK